MTTSNSPKHALKKQAADAAKMIKQAERGIYPDVPHVDKIRNARENNSELVFTVAMDDKFLKITMTWELIKDTKEDALAAYIYKQMRGANLETH